MNKRIKVLNPYVLILLAVSLYLFNQVGLVMAQESTPSADDVNRIASQLFCPVCENIPLDECQTTACEGWRDLIRQHLGEGWTDEEIKAYFVAQYGDRVLGEPPPRGLNWLLYVLPPMVILVAAVLLVAKLKRQHEEPIAEPTECKDPYLEMVERDLRNMD